jgi:predicted PurR-regulated permease PerM
MSEDANDLHDSPEPPRHARPVWVYPLGVLFAWAAAIVLFIFLFDPLSTVLLGILAAAVVASTLNPLLRYIPGPRGVAAALLGLCLIAGVGALLLALSWPLAAPVKAQVAQWPQTKQAVDTFLGKWSDQLGLRETLNVDQLVTSVVRFFAGSGGQSLFSRSADVSLAILIWLAFIFIGSIFILADPDERLLEPAVALAPTRRQPQLRDALNALGAKYRRWVIGTMISMCIVFSASALGYYFIGLKLALPLALVAGVCEIVPTVGPATACVIAMLFGAATSGGGAVVGVLTVYAVIQSIEAYVILPMIMRGAVKIHPAVTLFTVVLWGKIFGVPGLMLAIPINLTLASLVDHLYLKPRKMREAAARQAHEAVV